MEASVAPAAPVNPRTRWYTIGGVVLVVALLILYSVMKSRRDAALVADLMSKDKARHVAAAQNLFTSNRFVDLILTQPPDARDAAILATEDWAKAGNDAVKKQAVDALLGISKGVDREANDPETAVKDRETAVRTNAWKTIGRIGDVAKDQLLVALKDPSGNVRGAAIEALGVIGLPAIPGLMAMMRDRETWGPAGDALTKIGQPALDPLTPLLDTPGYKRKDRDLRLKMAAMLGGFDNQKIVPNLLRHINDDAPNIPQDRRTPGMRRQVIRTLASLQDQRATPEVIRVMREDPQVRLDAISALGEFKDPRAVDPLVDQFKNYDYDVPANAIIALAKIGAPALPRLLKEAKNPDAQIRTNATAALATIGGPGAVGPLLAAAKDPVDGVRAAAVQGMASFTGPNAVRAAPLLIASFSDSAAEVSNGAVASLTQMGTNAENATISTQIVNPLVQLLNPGGLSADVYNKRVYYAERVLSQLGAPALPALIAALRTGPPPVKKWAALTLGDMKQNRDLVSRALPDLRTLAQSSPNPDVKWAAQDALNRLGAAS